MRICLLVIATTLTYFTTLSAQFFPSNEAQADSIYQINIKKSRINGVYIPKNIEEAITELEALTDPQALIKFKIADEDKVASKLHFGLGRWIRYNWNLEQGSRLGEHLRQLGIYNYNDQSDALIRLWHRKLTNKDLDVSGLAEYYQDKWAREKQKLIEEGTVIGSETKPLPKKQ